MPTPKKKTEVSELVQVRFNMRSTNTRIAAGRAALSVAALVLLAGDALAQKKGGDLKTLRYNKVPDSRSKTFFSWLNPYNLVCGFL